MFLKQLLFELYNLISTKNNFVHCSTNILKLFLSIIKINWFVIILIYENYNCANF